MSRRDINEIFDFPHGDLIVEKIHESRDRIRNAYSELFSGYGKTAEETLNVTTRVEEGYTGIVAVRDIAFYTFCEHHFLPFFGTADVAYQPRNIITGIGKIVRLVNDVHARRLQIQETMTKDIADDLMRVLKAEGALVRTKAKHLCMCSRGPSDDNAYTEVVYRMGCLKGTDLVGIFQ